MQQTSSSGKILIATLIVIGVTAAAFAMILSNPPISGDDNEGSDNDDYQVKLLLNDSIVRISSDRDLVSQAQSRNWTGNGTAEDPILIENLGIQSQNHCIKIRSVSLHFVIQNCTLHSTDNVSNGIGIYLRNCSHATIRNCSVDVTFSGIEVFQANGTTIEYCDVSSAIFAINISESINTMIAYNKAEGKFSGISVTVSNHTLILNNTVTNGRFGLVAQFSFFCNMTGNVLKSNEDGALVEGRCGYWYIVDNLFFNNTRRGISLKQNASNCVLFHNRIGWNNEGNALDDGLNNAWDNGIAEGNYWNDFSGSGVYTIPGAANSTDHFPMILSSPQSTISEHFRYQRGGPVAISWIIILPFPCNQ